MRKTVFLVIVCLLTLCASQIFAADSVPKDLKNSPESQEKIAAQSFEVLFQLGQSVDYWHNANLRGNKKEVDKYLVHIFKLITDDIKFKSKSDYELTVAEDKNSSDAAVNENSKSSEPAVKNYVKAKKYLLKGLRKSQSFSYQYRLLNDYLDLLRKEYRANKVEWADNTEQDSE